MPCCRVDAFAISLAAPLTASLMPHDRIASCPMCQSIEPCLVGSCACSSKESPMSLRSCLRCLGNIVRASQWSTQKHTTSTRTCTLIHVIPTFQRCTPTMSSQYSAHFSQDSTPRFLSPPMPRIQRVTTVSPRRMGLSRSSYKLLPPAGAAVR